MGASLEQRRARDKTWTRDRKLGEGGAAIAHLGVRKLGREDQRAALKEIKEDLWTDPEFQEQFWAEVEAVASLRHSKIVGIIDIQPELGRLVLDLVDGVDLQRLVNAMPEHRLSWDLVALIASELCYALRYAHRRRRRGEEACVVHRDVKASNVLISYEGEVKLTDFGLARITKNTGPHSMVIRGTVECLSPEQTRPEEPLDGRSDLFSLGGLLYELLTGQRPFTGATETDIVYAIREGQRRSLDDFDLEDCPAELIAIVEQLLATKREDRPANADAVLDRLENLQMPHRVRELGRLARMALPPVTVSVELDESDNRSRFGARHRAVPRSRLVMVAASVSLVGGFASLGASRLLNEPDESAALVRPAMTQPVLTSMSPITAAPPSEQTSPTSAQALEPSPQEVTLPVGRDEDPNAQPAAPTPASPPSSAPAATAPSPSLATPTKPAKKRTAQRVQVFVGSIPLPQVNVWVDGKPQGRGPAEVWLRPGEHEFAAGRDKPQYIVTETVMPDTTPQRFLIKRDE